MLILVGMSADKAQGLEPCPPQRLAWPPEGHRITFPLSKDTWLSAVGDEVTGSNGGSRKLKLKGRQEYILFDADLSGLKGKLITGAMVHMRSATPDTAPFLRLGISTIATSWEEGSSTRYRPQKGSACYLQAAYGQQDWSYRGSTLMDVVFGRGHTIWKFADCTEPDSENWQNCAIDSDVVAARIAGLSSGFCVHDEVGNTWSLENGNFEYTNYPNRFCYSRESGRSAPRLTVWVGKADELPPFPVSEVQVDAEGLPAGEALVRWKTPGDVGGGKTLGFHVSYMRDGREDSIPRYLIPMAKPPGEWVRMHLRDLDFKPGQQIKLSIKPVDSAGNIGRPTVKTIRLAPLPCRMPESMADIPPFLPDEFLPVVGGVKVSVLDLLDKIDPLTGRLIPDHGPGYRGGNHLYSAAQRRIRLQSARNEHVAFQLSLTGLADNIKVDYGFPLEASLRSAVFQFGYVNTAKVNVKRNSPLPDPLIPLAGAFSIPSVAGSVFMEDQRHHSLICELYIPHHVQPGKKTGTLSISVGSEVLELAVDLTVWNFTLPNKLSFVPEMNAYGKAFPFDDYDYYRLAHAHRTCVNRLPYGWRGVPYYAPRWQGKDFDWSRWDSHVALLLNGTAFAGLPREKEPVDVFYLPFSENWPANLFENYTPSYWADEAFSPQYVKEMTAAFSAFAEHCDEKKWHDTIFQFYLNNKVYYRKKDGRSSAPWIFDEPVNTQDFWALRWYGLLWRSAVDPVKGRARMWYRGDISYTQHGRDMLRGLMDVVYIGGNTPQKTRMWQEDQMLWGRSYFSEYGSANRVEEGNTQPVAWCLGAWSRGAMGVMPWQTIGSKQSWKVADQSALFYPHATGPRPSVRLKAFTVGQQFVEYLMHLMAAYDLPRHVVARWVNQTLGLGGQVQKTSESDAGTLVNDHFDPIALWRIRYMLGDLISTMAPPYQRALTTYESPETDLNTLPPLGYVRNGPVLKSHRPVCDTFHPR